MKAIATCVILAAVAPAAAAAGAATPWRSWRSWTVVDAGSTDLRARIDHAWGGLAALVDPARRSDGGGLAWSDLDARLASTAAEAGAAIDPARPVRELSRPGPGGEVEIAILFAVAARGRAPDQCAYVERDGGELALVCGAEAPAAALRDDFLARGAPAIDARALHVELANDHGEPVRAVLDVREDDAGLHAHELAIARAPEPAGALSAAARAAAARMAASPRDVIADVIDDGTSKVDGVHFFLDRPFARVFGDALAQRRASARVTMPGVTYAFAVEASPPHLPRGARAIRTRTTDTSSGVAMICTPRPGGVMGGCTERRVPRVTTVDESTVAYVPGDGGTWMIDLGALDAAARGALPAFFTAPVPAALPPAWTTTARALGVAHVEASGATLWWSRTRGAGAEVSIDLEGRLP